MSRADIASGDVRTTKNALSPVERAAVSMLRTEGWTVSTLAMVFEVDDGAICRATDPQLGRELATIAFRREVTA